MNSQLLSSQMSQNGEEKYLETPPNAAAGTQLRLSQIWGCALPLERTAATQRHYLPRHLPRCPRPLSIFPSRLPREKRAPKAFRPTVVPCPASERVFTNQNSSTSCSKRSRESTFILGGFLPRQQVSAPLPGSEEQQLLRHPCTGKTAASHKDIDFSRRVGVLR